MTSPVPPVLAQRPRRRVVHGHEFVDDFDWVRDGGDEVLAHLRAETAYAEAMTAHLNPLRERVFQEIRTRIQEDDASVAFWWDGWWYYSRTRRGSQHVSLHRCPGTEPRRRPRVTSDPLPGEQLLVDGDAIAAEHGSEFFSLGSWDVSADGARLLYAVDLEGDEEYHVVVRDIASGELIDDALADVCPGAQLMADGERFLYVRNDHAWRPFELWEHRLGTPTDQDRLLLREEDERFRVDLLGDATRTYLYVCLSSRLTSEWHLLDAHAAQPEPRVVVPRRDGVTYDIDLWGEGELVVLHDRDHRNGSVAVMPVDAHSDDAWREILPGSDRRRLTTVSAFADHLVVGAVQDAIETLIVFGRCRGEAGSTIDEGYPIDPGFEIFSAGLSHNLVHDAPSILVMVESWIHPPAYFELEMATGAMVLVRAVPAPGHQPSRYRQWREWATALDGTSVPITLVARCDVRPDGTAPALLYGYGAYESSIEAVFETVRFPLIDRGVVYAVAHVRGGGEMGRRWWDEGSMEHKENSFTDLLACARHLTETGWAAPGRLAAEGRSAGGLLVGAAMNLDPGRFCLVVVGVPFVDVVTTMLDPDVPLTVGEWEEWGDPVTDPAAYHRLRGYSPYENVRAVDYPRVLVTTSLNDQRVCCAEPVKWVAELRRRALHTDRRPILLRCTEEAGHGGPSGRYTAWREVAWETAVVLDALGLTS